MTLRELEKIVLEKDIDTSVYRDGRHVDEALEILSGYTKRTLLSTVFADQHYIGSRLVVSAMEDIWAHYLDKNYFVQSDANLLNGKSAEGWKGEYFKALASHVAANGKVAYQNHSWRFGSYDYDREQKLVKNRVVAVMSVKETQWSDFGGTFVDDDKKIGLEAEVIYNNGYNGILLLESSFQDVMSAIL